jgi:thioredoxin-like negative regulator of GroEL
MKRQFTFTKKDFILLIILGITVLLVDYSLSWYKVYKENNLSTSIISKYITEVTSTDFQNYIAENGDTIVYMGIPDDEECRRFEKRFKKIINKYDLRNEIVYLNVKTVDLNALSNQYNSESVIDAPTVVAYNNSKIEEFIDNNNSDMKDDSVIDLLRKYGVIDYND